MNVAFRVSPKSPAVIMVGRIPFVAPLGRDALSPAQLVALTRAADAVHAGRVRQAQRIVWGLQRELGVSGSEYISVLGAAAEAVQAENARLAGRARRTERQRVMALPRVEEDLPFTDEQRKVLRQADALDADADRLCPADRKARAKRTAAERRQGRINRKMAQDMRAQVQAQHEARLEVRAVEAGLAERRALETARSGEDVKLARVAGGEGVKRLSNADGLMSVAMSLAQRQAGFAYRDIFRSATIGWSSPLDAIGCGGRGSATAMDLSRLRTAQRMRQLQQFDAEVAAQLGADHVAVLKAVAGEGKSMREFAPASRARERATRALLASLDVLHPLFGTRLDRRGH
ncbi:hypothetical protein [Brevundimonas sp.]|uniref:hypothetical protein n=1 Tax=Brevundimonas sp. TaxID=1871086 RepID=UPI002D761B54|nr:hypothetical protein [Brevundimonas sp.]HYD26912.1 hypothetical protein [Brevundimonas sp.]